MYEEFDTVSFLVGAVSAYIAFWFGRFVAKKVIKKKQKHNFKTIRKEMDEGYEGLLRAAKSFHEFNDVLKEVSDAKR